MNTPIKVSLDKKSYKVYIEENSLENIFKYHFKLFKNRRAIIITDKNVAKIYLKKMESNLKSNNLKFCTYILQPGERSKSFKQLEKLTNSLLRFNISRDDVIYALGGGVIGDLSGFVASVILRGVDWVQLRTSLLAQVDSSVGGKTAINTKFGKNLI